MKMFDIKRCAFLIGREKSSHGNLPGVPRDISGMNRYLHSANGGVWDNNEIMFYESPKKLLLLNQLAESCDFCIFYFAGHGYHDSTDNETHISINDDEYLSVKDICPNSKRQLLIVDACRKVVASAEISERLLEKLAAEQLGDFGYRLKCRILYNEKVMSADVGRSRIFSCSIDESANESAAGGDFTQLLINKSDQWISQNRELFFSPQSVLYVPEVFNLVNQSINRTIQNPVLENGRRINSFPFAVAP
jgi:hypothetical protein